MPRKKISYDGFVKIFKKVNNIYTGVLRAVCLIFITPQNFLIFALFSQLPYYKLYLPYFLGDISQNQLQLPYIFADALFFHNYRYAHHNIANGNSSHLYLTT